jgi:hypothetical protein
MWFGRAAAVDDPRFDVVGEPDLAVRQVGDRFREVPAGGELVDALAADSAQPDPDRARPSGASALVAQPQP